MCEGDGVEVADDFGLRSGVTAFVRTACASPLLPWNKGSRLAKSANRVIWKPLEAGVRAWSLNSIGNLEAGAVY